MLYKFCSRINVITGNNFNLFYFHLLKSQARSAIIQITVPSICGTLRHQFIITSRPSCVSVMSSSLHFMSFCLCQ